MGIFRKSRARIRKDASDWVVRLASGGTSEDRAAFLKWRAADPRHAEAYDRIVGIWNQAGQLSRSPATAMRPVAATKRPLALGLALAASLIAAIMVSALLLGSRWQPGSASEAAMAFDAGPGEIRPIDLADGSKVTLDSESRLEAKFTEANRRLTLKKGRVRFQVAHEARPFVVRAGSIEVVATGTIFDVSLVGDRTAVFLVEGSVEVRTKADRHGPQRLKPGQKLILSASRPPERQRATGDDASWPRRMLEFDNMRLDRAAALANRYSDVRLTLANERIRSLRITGTFRTGDVAGFARTVAAAFDLRAVPLPDGALVLEDPEPGADTPPR